MPPRTPLHLASGTGVYKNCIEKAIRFVRYGCTNRPFYHIVVMESKKDQRKPPIEQLGTYDPCENQFNEKLVALNFERIQFWLGQGNVKVSKPVEELLGLCGFLPIHPRTYMTAWRTRRTTAEAEAAAAAEATKAANTEENQSDKSSAEAP